MQKQKREFARRDKKKNRIKSGDRISAARVEWHSGRCRRVPATAIRTSLIKLKALWWMNISLRISARLDRARETRKFNFHRNYLCTEVTRLTSASPFFMTRPSKVMRGSSGDCYRFNFNLRNAHRAFSNACNERHGKVLGRQCVWPRLSVDLLSPRNAFSFFLFSPSFSSPMSKVKPI